MIIGDYTELIKETLKAERWGRCEEIRMKGIGKITVFGKRGQFRGVVSPLQISNNLDEVFRSLQEAVDEISYKYGSYPELLFQGSPDGIPFPPWFEDWMRQNRIEFHIQAAEDIKQRAKENGLLRGNLDYNQVNF